MKSLLAFRPPSRPLSLVFFLPPSLALSLAPSLKASQLSSLPSELAVSSYVVVGLLSISACPKQANYLMIYLTFPPLYSSILKIS
jgi:hypothetical protein